MKVESKIIYTNNGDAVLLARHIDDKRDNTIHAIASLIGRGTFYQDAENIYDAIKRGDITID